MRRAISLAIATVALTPGAALAQSTAQGGYSPTPIAVPEGGGGGPAVLGVTEDGDGGGPAVLGVTESGEGATSPTGGSGNPTSGTAGVTASAGPAAGLSGTSLPFTGLDVGIIAALAVGLVGLGFGLRRATRFNEA